MRNKRVQFLATTGLGNYNAWVTVIKVKDKYYLYLDGSQGTGVEISKSLASSMKKYFSVKENRETTFLGTNLYDSDLNYGK